MVHNFVLLVFGCSMVWSQRFVEDVMNDTAVHRVLDNLLKPSHYDRRIRPKPDTSGPTDVAIDCFLRSISSIDEIAMEFSTDILVRQHWSDTRLRYKTADPETFLAGPPEVVDRIWKPDLFFANEKKGYFHDITIPNTMLRLFPNGSLLYSARYSLTFSCQMRLEKFPFDTQNCIIQIGSFSFTDKALIFYWKEPNPLTINSDLKLPKFQLIENRTLPCRNEHYTGNFSCLRIQFTFMRELTYYLAQIFIPTGLLVIASWISFWIDVDAIPARTTLGVTILLTTTAQGGNIKDLLPPVSYTKAIDVWVGVCTFFVFAALLEFALVNLVARQDTRKAFQMAASRELVFTGPLLKSANQTMAPVLSGGQGVSFRHLGKKRKSCTDCGEPFLCAKDAELATNNSSDPKSNSLTVDLIEKPRAVFVDKVARALFPFTFFTFVGGYLLIYCWII